ncbi:hypothetical protein [Parapedobacter pyrenivorans]|uniref:hypothetical protein n=1 Tax=Parapedobacter pyrenivorans TaxID=1305674 RepID=UPI0016699EF8|nr:hypothetical protein [Parapedobacter pyrenivorans]
MRRYFQLSEVLMRIVAMAVLVAVVGISLMRATHTHAHEKEQVEDHNHHNPDHTSDCDFCACYVHFAPKEAGARVSFTFSIPARSFVAQLGQLSHRKICTGPRNQYINKGPPASSNLI